MTKRRVVVTGLGALTPIGNTVKTSWDNLLAGKSGAGPITHFDVSEMTTKFAAMIKDFDVDKYMPPKESRRLDPFIRYAVAASVQAVEDAGLDVSKPNPRVGVAIGSGIGGLGVIEETRDILVNSGPRRVSPFFIPGSIINMAAGVVSIRYGFQGPNFSIVSACTTGGHNIGYAARTIAYGDADVMLAGGAEKASVPLGVSGFGAARALSTRNDAPDKASRPWDKDRDGFLLGDGAGTLVLEEYEHAKKRGAPIYAELIGFGMSADAYHMTAPSGEGAVACMRNTLKDAGVNPEDIDYINAHGTSTPAGDKGESDAVKAAFGDHAYKLAVSSTKSSTGHLLGAAGAVEAIFCILAMRDQIAPATLNLEHPEEGCDLDYVPLKPREMPINMVLNNSFGFGGTNASMIFKKV